MLTFDSRRRSGSARVPRRLSRHRTAPLAETLERRALLSAGDFDPTFSGDGRLFFEERSYHRTGWDIAAQSDGRLVVIGSRGQSGTDEPFQEGYWYDSDALLTRYNPDGSLDATFGDGGEVAADFGGQDFGTEFGRRVGIAPDGGIVAAIIAQRDYGGTDERYFNVLLRYLPNGAPDTSFGNGGRIDLPLVGWDLALAPGGEIVVASRTPQDASAVLRFTADGRPDPSFGGGDGMVDVDFGISQIAVAPDGRIVASGASGNDRVIARFTPSGDPDPTLDGDGQARSPITPGSFVNDLVLDASGRILLAGGGPEQVALWRYTAAGLPDTTFGGGDGVATAAAPDHWYERLAGAVVLPSGKIVGAGMAHHDVSEYSDGFLAVGFNADGSLDTSFGAGGFAFDHVLFHVGFALAVALSRDGKPIAVGTIRPDSTATHALIQYNADGTPDASFGRGGRAVGPFGTRRGVSDHVVQPDRKIVVGGTTHVGAGYDFFLARFNPDGSPDATFGNNGQVVTHLGGLRNSVRALLVQDDGTIVAAGTSDGDVALARYNPDGSLDTTFSGDGKLVYESDGGYPVRDMDAYPGGRIVVAGGPRLLRFNADGSLDTTFAGDGSLDLTYSLAAVVVQGTKIVTYQGLSLVRFNADGSRDATFSSIDLPLPPDAERQNSYVRDMELTPDGDIVVLGHTFASEEEKVALWRINPDGTLDGSFGGGLGYRFWGLPGAARTWAWDVAVQDDGRIVVAGYGFVLRCLADGTLDPDFGVDGITRIYDPFWPTDVEIDAAGDLVVLGGVTTTRNHAGWGLVRFDGSGAPSNFFYDRTSRALIVRGTHGDDTIRVSLSGGRLFVTLNGVTRNYTATSVRGAVRVHGRGGNDTLVAAGSIRGLLLDGGPDDDTLRGGAGAETLQGGDGIDHLDGGRGADHLMGGAGTDSVDYRSRTGAVRVGPWDPRLREGYSGEAGENDAVWSDVEKIYGGAGDDVLTVPNSAGGAAFGGAGNDTLFGTNGPDALWGEAGDDTLQNSHGADYFRGGAGSDTFLVQHTNTLVGTRFDVSLDGQPNDGWVDGGTGRSEGDNVYTDIENLVGGPGDDRLTGSAGNNSIDGRGGNDTLLGLAGNDTLTGGAGDDHLLGGDDDDTLIDYQGQNTLDGGPGTDTINGVVEGGQTTTLEAENPTLARRGLLSFEPIRRRSVWQTLLVIT